VATHETLGGLPVYAPAVEDQSQGATSMPPDGHHKPVDIDIRDVGVMEVEVETEPVTTRSQCDGGDNREPIVAIPRIVDGGVTARSPRSTYERLQHEAAFV
jgi:hypothetical protein